MVFHWCLYNKQNITCPLMDMNFIFSWSTWYLTCSLRSLVRYRVDHSKIKFISTRGHVISSMYPLPRVCKRMLSFSTKSWACCRYSLKYKMELSQIPKFWVKKILKQLIQHCTFKLISLLIIICSSLQCTILPTEKQVPHCRAYISFRKYALL